LDEGKMPKGILPSSMCSVKEISIKNSTTSKDFENLDINNVLEIIEVLLNYIRKKKNREPPASADGFVRALGVARKNHAVNLRQAQIKKISVRRRKK